MSADANPTAAAGESEIDPLAGVPIWQQAATYSRSLLRIKIAVNVTLASKKQAVNRILDLGPGAIIHFEKSCEEMLDLEVGGQIVAQGEPVKVGDKFGIRLTSLAMPGERFLTLAGPCSFLTCNKPTDCGPWAASDFARARRARPYSANRLRPARPGMAMMIRPPR